MTSRSFAQRDLVIPHLGRRGENEMEAVLEDILWDLEKRVDAGQIACATLLLATQPTATNTVTIGSDVYEFDGAGSNINVALGVDVDATRAAFVAAINTLGTENLVAEDGTPIADAVTIFKAEEPGGDKVAGAGDSVALAETLADAGDVWNQANMNITGKAEGIQKMCTGEVIIDATNLATEFYLECGFTVSKVMWAAFDTNGAPAVTTATVDPSGTGILVNADAGATALTATDVVRFIAWGA